MQRGVVVGIAGLALLVAFSAWRRGQSHETRLTNANPAPSSESGASAREVAELRNQIATLRAQVRSQGAVLATQSNATATDPAAEQPSPPDPDPTPKTAEELRAIEVDYSNRVVAALDAELATESRDPSWSSQTERQIGSALDGLASKGLRLDSSQCSTSLCKVVVKAESPAGALGVPTMIRSLPPFDASGMFFEYHDNQTFVYLERPGYSFPRVAAE